MNNRIVILSLCAKQTITSVSQIAVGLYSSVSAISPWLMLGLFLKGCFSNHSMFNQSLILLLGEGTQNHSQQQQYFHLLILLFQYFSGIRMSTPLTWQQESPNLQEVHMNLKYLFQQRGVDEPLSLETATWSCRLRTPRHSGWWAPPSPGGLRWGSSCSCMWCCQGASWSQCSQTAWALYWGCSVVQQAAGSAEIFMNVHTDLKERNWIF